MLQHHVVLASHPRSNQRADCCIYRLQWQAIPSNNIKYYFVTARYWITMRTLARTLLLAFLVTIGICLSSFPRGTCQLHTETAKITVPDDYATIQGAINAANAGDTVYVRNGIYYELVDVNKTVSLVGENKDTTIIDGSGFPYSAVLAIFDASDATIQNLTVQNGTAGLFLGSANHTKLRNISLRGNQQNIILIDPSSLQNTTYDIDESNTVDGKPICFWNNRENEQIPSDAGYVALINCNNVTAQGLNLTKDGIELVNVKNCLIENVTISETQVPLQAIDAENCTIRNSSFNNSASGVTLRNFNRSRFICNIISNVTQQDAVFVSGSFSSTINENTILNNSRGYYGLHVVGGNDDLISGNKILNNTNGIQIEYSNNNSVSSNQIEGNFGVQLVLSNSSFNTISGNRIVGSVLGIPVQMGLVLGIDSNNNTITGNLIEGNHYGIYILRSENNSIFHNNIITNDIQAGATSSYETHVYPNVWDDGYPSGGNHWSDYTGIDNNHDGIGDTYYVIADGNVDNYPLMNLYVVPEFYHLMYILLFASSTLAAVAIQKRRKA
jgi:parallel beta-helix repeat protein